MKLVILAALVGFSGAFKTSTSASFARAWLSAHAAPQADELAELRDVNPDAYALVKALLTKRSLGLLDPKHPTASFAAPAHTDDDAPHGAAAFAGLITPEELAQHGKGSSLDAPPAENAVYPDAPAPEQHHDFWNWKPQSSAVSDDAMVQNVLGAVASLKGPKISAPTKDLSPMEADAASLGLDAASLAAAPVTVAAPVAAAPVAAAPVGNPYLRGLSLDTSAPVASASSDSSTASGSNPLTSFSWGDDSKPGPQQDQRAVKKPVVSALSSWLTGGKSDAPADEAGAAPEQKHDSNAVAAMENPYLASLQ